MELNLTLKIYITDGQGRKFMGIGMLWLLEHIQRHGSILNAAKQMQISYSKAYHMLSVLESALGRQVVIREKGGNSRKGTRLTPLGTQLISRYTHFQDQVKSQAEQAFADFVADVKEQTDAYE